MFPMFYQVSTNISVDEMILVHSLCPTKFTLVMFDRFLQNSFQMIDKIL